MTEWQSLSMAGFLLVFARCAGALLLLPPWNWRHVPVTVRLGLAGAVTLAIAPLLGAELAAPAEFVALLAGIVRELTIGLVIGFLGALVFWGLLLAGQVIEHYVGGSAAGGFGDEQLGPIAQLYYVLGLVLFIIIGGHRWLVEQLCTSFTTVPVTGPISSSGIVTGITGAATQMFLIGVVVAAPVITALFLADVVLAMLARALPNLIWAPAIPAVRWPVAIVALIITLPLLAEFVGWQFATIQTDLTTLLGSM